mmetsp:Transcript_11256/g.18647  ORF Transcript_11256/g.18647 Transcript_11256/m.18647 type:complete len:205 (+) Transcript_11256:117-731(+)|eukprot:CAMPEP_0119029420 /NCGR_PEP_ID=MMETSP1176-20130426/40509_1 /TAXON_ID=265551 /ORGANISM="Synedropsis recta cf, Strain CCMP1620" /LENGTH=204 /DNA_ID=CAMNT_0006985761 /DNA_START=65 /DNA_END=679 /DNA_ORIENTATION=-
MNSISNIMSSLPNESLSNENVDSGLVRVSPKSRKSIILNMNTPLFRRDSTTDEIILPDLISDSSVQDGEESDSSVTDESSFTNQIMSTFYNHIVDTFAPPPASVQVEQQSGISASHAIFLGQKGSEQKKARALTQNREEFQKLKTQLKESGMVTNYATRAVLNSIVEGCAEEMRDARMRKNSNGISKVDVRGLKSKGKDKELTR